MQLSLDLKDILKQFYIELVYEETCKDMIDNGASSFALDTKKGDFYITVAIDHLEKGDNLSMRFKNIEKCLNSEKKQKLIKVNVTQADANKYT